MPYVPEWQFTTVGRYAFNYGDYPGYAQVAISYTGETWNDLEVAQRLEQDAYTLVNFSTGIQAESWSIDLFIDNLTDERSQIDRLDPGYPSSLDTRTVVNRPRTIGLRFGQYFD